MTPTYRAIARLIGEERTDELVRRLGGTELHIPESPQPGSRLSLAVGQQAAQALCAEMVGRTIVIPSRYSIESKRRIELIRKDLVTGDKPSKIAVRYGVSARYVRQLREAL